MDILNNLWSALSSPNENLVNILTIPLFFIENYLYLLLFTSILNITTNKKQKITYIIVVSIISAISMYAIPAPINFFVNYVLIFICIHVIIKTHLLKSFLAMLFPPMIFLLISIFLVTPYLSLFNISSEQMALIPIYKLLYLLLTYIFVSLIILILKYKNLKLDFLDDLDTKTKYVIFANLVAGILTLILQSIITFYYIDTLPSIITFLSFIFLVIYFSISIFCLTRILKLNLTTKKLESAESYNNTLRILHDNVRGFKHDFDNIVTTIGGYIRTDDMNGLKKYYLELEDDCQRVNNLYVLNPNVVNNDGIYNLLTKKYNEAESKNIKVNISFLLDLGELKMKIYDFARILGILLDNAIEASSECENKIINLTFRNDEKNTRQLIIIENTYNDKNLDTEKIFEKGVSGKENHTGLGLWEVRKIIKKNNNINLYTTKTDTLFSQQLEIYY